MTGIRAPLSVYVHVPFCTVKCGYCDFNAYAGMEALSALYRDALLAEIAGYDEVFHGREIATIGFGGGTPGEAPPADIAAVIAAIAARAPLAPGAEVSLEANPGTTTLAALRALRKGGVTRLSFGAQSFDAGELRFLDRIHSPQATATSVGLAREAGFEHVNLDLIYGLPGQSMASWERSLAAALALDIDHLSCYCLTVEEGTPLARRVAAGAVTPGDADLAADMYDRAAELLAAAGFSQYELSNWARPGGASRHNQVYWTDGEYLGIGAGAHGYLGGERYGNIAHPRAYIAALSGGAACPWPARLSAYRPSREMAIADWISLALRLTAGFDEAAFARRFGVAMDTAVGPVLDACEEAGLLERDGDVRLSVRGRQLHSEVAVRLIQHLRAATRAGKIA